MHDNRKLKTLLACIDDLTHTVDEMAASEPVHQADQDLLLHHARRLYEALLRLETTAAVAPVAHEQGEITEEVADLAVMQEDEGRMVEGLSAQVEAAVEAAIESGETVEVDISLEHPAGPVEAAQEEIAEEEAVAHAHREAMEEVAQEEAAAQSLREAMEEAAQEEAANPGWEAADEPVAASNVAAEPSPAEEAESAPQAVPPVTPTAAQSFAFSLTGILERSGESQLVMAHLKLKPIEDLKSGIGLNEKFLFIRELFSNDHMAYAEAIEKLNQADGIAAAEQVLAEDILPKHQWDLETEAALSFLHLIYRRFAKHQ